MKKVCYTLFCSGLFMLSLFFGTIVAQSSSDKSVAGFWRSDFVKGIGYEGAMHLSAKGYEQSTYEDASISTFRGALYTDDVIFIHTHGDDGVFTLASGRSVTGNLLNSYSGTMDAKLVYISACNTGNYSATNGHVGPAMCSKGVDAVVAFRDTVAASTGTDGIHRFNSIVVYKLANGYTIARALSTALEQIKSESGTYWGADSYIVYGNGTITIY